MYKPDKFRKSVTLAKLYPGWLVCEYPADPAYADVSDSAGKVLFELSDSKNFYTKDKNDNPHLMPWAWHILNWVMTERGVNEVFWGLYDFSGVCFLPPKLAQQAWLDIILGIVIDGVGS